MRKLNSLVSTHRDLRKDGHTFAKRYSLADKDVRVEDLLGWEFKGQRSCYIMALIIRRGTRDRVQDIVSANGDIGIARPLASTTVRMKSLINQAFRRFTGNKFVLDKGYILLYSQSVILRNHLLALQRNDLPASAVEHL